MRNTEKVFITKCNTVSFGIKVYKHKFHIKCDVALILKYLYKIYAVTQIHSHLFLQAVPAIKETT